jgi:hypothetical protein
MPESQQAGEIEKDHHENRRGAQKLDYREQAQAIIAVDNHAADKAEHQAWTRFAEAQNAQGHSRARHLISEPIKRNLPDKLAD